ncbi:MAG: gamma carbonic anhydrase family protein [Hahellaceae bacterium]|nr:gamma carbonic anhydrase family protein [Hahellaceae bacterium]
MYSLETKIPTLIGEGHYIAPNAMVIGQVVLEAGSSVWFGAVIRADNDVIKIGKFSNIQDGAVLHTDEGLPLVIGEGVTVGHRAVLHGCLVNDYCLIGIGATILNRAKIGAFSIVAANALVPEGMEIPDGVLVVGSPAKIKRELTMEEKDRLKQGAIHYVKNAQRYSEYFVGVDSEFSVAVK